MTWEVRFTEAALRDLDKLPEKIRNAIVEFVVYTLPGNPRRMSKPLLEEFEGIQSARRGEYRVLFILDDDAKTLRVVRARHRKDSYRLPAPIWE